MEFFWQCFLWRELDYKVRDLKSPSRCAKTHKTRPRHTGIVRIWLCWEILIISRKRTAETFPVYSLDCMSQINGLQQSFFWQDYRNATAPFFLSFFLWKFATRWKQMIYLNRARCMQSCFSRNVNVTPYRIKCAEDTNLTIRVYFLVGSLRKFANAIWCADIFITLECKGFINWNQILI